MQCIDSKFEWAKKLNDSLAHDSMRQLAWAVQRLAQIGGVSIDAMRLQATISAQFQLYSSLAILNPICKELEFDSPKLLRRPDRVCLPLIACAPEQGWGVLVDCNPEGLWLLITDRGAYPLPIDVLRDRVAQLRFMKVPHLGLGFFRRDPASATFFSYLQESLYQHRQELIEACFASLFIGFLALATSLFSMQVYDRVIPTRGEFTLVILSLGVIFSIGIELAMKFARASIMDYVVVGVDSLLSREIFHRLLQLRVDQIPSSVGSLAGQIRGYEQVRAFYTSATLFTLVDLPIGLIFVFVILFMATPLVALIPLIFSIIALIIGFSIRSKIFENAKEGAALSNMKTGLLVETVEGIETIKAGAGGWKFLSRWIDVNRVTIQADLKSRHASESVGYLAASVQQFSYAAMVAAGAVVVMRGDMTMGALIACSILSGRILTPIMSIPGLLAQHAHAQAALGGLEKLYCLKTDNHGVARPLVPSSIAGHFSFSNVAFAYADNPVSLRAPRLEIRPGERIAILGPIGAGKSTLLKLLSGLYLPQKGLIQLDGLDLSHIDRQVVTQHVGYLQQDHRLFQGTLRENLLIGLPDPGDDALFAVMKRTGMEQFVSAHPKGLERPIMEGGKGLSGGQKQLVAFTRLILCNYKVLLMDEPTSSMDDEQERRCIAALENEASSGKSLVIVTHKPNLLQLVTRVILIVGSSILMDGPRDLVLEKLKHPPSMSHKQ